MKKLLVVLGLVTAVSTTGCSLYFDDDDGDGGDCPPGTYLSYDDYGPVCVDDGSGYGCTSDYQCAAGCYCQVAAGNGVAGGTCVEAGFCSSDADCPPGTVCDESRQSCDPDGGPGVCDSDDDCGYGAYCDEVTGSCVPSWGCTTDADCGTGYTCNADGTCIPIPCDSNDDCAAGCYCDASTGGCVETCYCTTDADATGAGYGYCDEPRQTCMPGEDPTPACEELTTQADCSARGDCENVYRGLNCTDPTGTPCTDGSAMCTCESYVWDECQAAGA